MTQDGPVNDDCYAEEDFEKVDKIDMHVHINSTATPLFEQSERDNFRLLTVNVDYSEFPPIDEQMRLAISLRKAHPRKIAYAATFSMNGWDEAGWHERTIERLKKAAGEGASAVKVWKNIGMEFRDKQGRMVMIDDPGFDPVFKYLGKAHIPVIGHLGEPRDCWLPLDKIMVKYVRDYFALHPKYHMYLQPELPSYEDQIRARDNMLAKNNQAVFIGAHLASLEWSVDRLGRYLDRFPSAMADTAARVGDLQYQTTRNWNGVRDFFIKYQDRLLYGTDSMQQPGIDPARFAKDVHDQWLSDWKYYCTDSTFSVPDLDEPVRGLGLPKTVIDKLFRRNAESVFPEAWK